MASLIKDIKLGADPELFVKELATGKFVPSLDLIGGNKDFPRAMSHPGFFCQEDNILVEFNIPPSSTKESFRENIRTGMRLFGEVLPPSKYQIEIATSHKFLPEQLLDPRADEFGCTPDNNAWLGCMNPKPAVPVDGLRSAGGHVHIGYELDVAADDTDRQAINREIVKWMDLRLGVPSMKLDKDTERRRLYGKAGAYRNKSYGVEYRTLSSFWLSSNSLIDWVWDETMYALNRVGNMEFIDNALMERIMAAINLNDESSIDYLFGEYQLKMI